jgi:hypothetical protein
LHDAIRHEDLEQVKKTLVEGASQLAIAKNNYGRTSLHIATLGENLSIIEYIVQNFPETVPLQDSVSTVLNYTVHTGRAPSKVVFVRYYIV